MARIRSIKPSFTSDEDLSSLDPVTHLLAVGLLCYADDEGYFNANPGLVKGAVIPLREPERSIGDMLEDLAKVGYLQFGTYAGKRYGRIVNFLKHQRVSHAQPSSIKPLPIVWENLPEGKQEDSVNVPENSGEAPEDSGTFRPELKGIELKGMEGKEGADAPPPGLHPLEYARGILERLEIPVTQRNSRAVAAAVEAVMKSGKSPPAATEYLIARALDERENGQHITAFWFEDGKYAQQSKRKTSKLDF